MHKQWTKWLMGLTLAAALMVGLAPVALQAAAPNAGAPGLLNTTGTKAPAPEATWTPAQLKPIHDLGATEGVTAGKRAQGQNASFKPNLPKAAAQLKQEIKASGVDLHKLPKGRFQAPASRMFVNSLVKAGVKVSEAVQKNPESLCAINAGWFAGPATASNTNGTAIVYGGGLNFYFASATDPAHPTVIPMGDMMMRVYFHGNTALVLGFYYSYEFDVTDPTSPALINYDYGMLGDVAALGMTGDGQYIVAAQWTGENIAVYDSEFNIIGAFDISALYSIQVNPAGFPFPVQFTDMTIDGSVVMLTDWDNYYIHFVDLSALACDSDPAYLGYIDDGAYGDSDCGQIMYQAPYLYTTYEPWWVYQPVFGPIIGCPVDNGYYIDIFNVPATTNPANFISVKYVSVNNYGNDLIAIRPAGNGHVALGLYDGQVAIWDAQLNTLLSFGTFGKFGPSTQGYGWCGSEPNWEYFTLDMGYDPAIGGVTANWGGGAYFYGAAMTQTGSYKTGDWAYNPVAAGNTIYVPSYVAGLGIVDNTDPTAPGTLGWLDTMPSIPFIGLVAVDGTTAYVASDYNTNFTKVFAADVSNPAAPAYLSSASTAFDVFTEGYGTMVESLEANGGVCWIGTDTHIVGVDFSNPSSPSVVASFTIGGTGAYGMATFTHPGFPLSHFLGVAEGQFIEWFDITTPAEYGGCPTPYFLVQSTPQGAFSTNIFFVNGTQFVNDILNNYVWANPIVANVGSACAYNELNWAASYSLSTAGVACTGPFLMSYAGTVGGHSVAALATDYYTCGAIEAMTTIDITNPAAMSFLNTPPQIVDGSYFGTGITGMLFSNNALYNAGGWLGMFDYLLVPGFMPPTVNTVTVTPNLPYLTGPVTITANVTASDSAVTSVVFTFHGYTIATVPASIAAHATANVSTTWNTSTWSHYGACNPYAVVAKAYDGGCNVSAAVASAGTYLINLKPTVSFSNWSPAIPSGTACAGPDAWIVCGHLCFTVTGVDGPCNQAPIGISQMALYLDGSTTPLTYINNPASGIWNVCLDTTTMSDGPHTLMAWATDNMGLKGSKTSATFTVHNIGPAVYVVEPVSGDVVSGHAVPLSANVVLGPSSPGIASVKFYLDPTNTTTAANVIATGHLIGTATTKDPTTGNWIANPSWDSTSTPYGNHVIVAVASEVSSATCAAKSMSPLVSFRLIAYTPPTVTATATPTSGNIPLAVAFAANVTNGASPFTYAWSFGDSSTGSGQATTHTYTTAGTFTWTVTLTDGMGTTATATGSITAINPIVPPTITGVSKMANPFRLKVLGSNFHGNCTVYINGVSVPQTLFKSSSELVAKKGSSLKDMVRKGVPVQITVKNNDDGGVSAAFTYTR